jgi:hypothetical protein
VVQLRPHKGIISDYVIWRSLFTYDAPLLVVMNEHTRTRRKHAPRHKRPVMDAAVALATKQIRVPLRLDGATSRHGGEQGHDEQDSRHGT